MKFTLEWLKDHLDTEASLDEIARTMVAVGLEVESITDPTKDFAAFRVGYVVEARPHPDADKLQILKVDSGSEILQVVCGAPNARAGLKGVFAPVGTYVPGIDLTLTKAKIRGVESHGMLCSEKELELSNEHQGIIELPESAEIGAPVASLLGLDDPIIDFEVTPNRPDTLGVAGIARDLAAAGLGTLKTRTPVTITGAFPCPIEIGLKFDAATAGACPAFAGRVVRGLTNGPSPDWMQKRLRAIGLRPINALVDITNYITYDRARPLHVYDADKVKGSIHARLGRAGETFTALDDHDYTATPQMCVISDDSGAIGFGGVMGGKSTGSSDETTNVIIESALFDPRRTAQTGRATGIESDARYRFERGVDPAFMMPGLDLATQLVLEFCGGEASEIYVAGTIPDTQRVIDFNVTQVKRLTGLALEQPAITKILDDLGFICAKGGKFLQVTPPSWRPDIEGPACLVEEVARITGYDALPTTPMPRLRSIARPVLTPFQDRVRLAKRALAARGLTEAVTWSFVSSEEAALFGGGAASLRLDNPISSALTDMRPSLLPGLIAALARNADRGLGDVALFEVGPSYAGDQPADQSTQASGVRRGAAGGKGAVRHWRAHGRPADVFDAKADALGALGACGAPVGSLSVNPDGAPAWYHPGRSGTLTLGPKNVLASFGEVHPRVLHALDISDPIAAFEITLDALPAARVKHTKTKPALDASDLMAVERDFAFVVDAHVPAANVMRAARNADKKLITHVALFDVFEDASLGEDKKSLAIAVTLQPRSKTLTDAEIEAVAAKVIAAVTKATGGVLRG